MADVLCDGRAITVARGQRLLDALTAADVSVPSSCRAGACQTCLVKATRGTPPAAAQIGLKEGLRLQGYFLACLAEPTEDLEITVDAGALSVPARIDRVDRLGADVVRVRVLPEGPFPHRGGQWTTLLRADGLARPYSIASVPESPEGVGALELSGCWCPRRTGRSATRPGGARVRSFDAGPRDRAASTAPSAVRGGRNG